MTKNVPDPNSPVQKFLEKKNDLQLENDGLDKITENIRKKVDTQVFGNLLHKYGFTNLTKQQKQKVTNQIIAILSKTGYYKTGSTKIPLEQINTMFVGEEMKVQLANLELQKIIQEDFDFTINNYGNTQEAIDMARVSIDQYHEKRLGKMCTNLLKPGLPKDLYKRNDFLSTFGTNRLKNFLIELITVSKALLWKYFVSFFKKHKIERIEIYEQIVHDIVDEVVLFYQKNTSNTCSALGKEIIFFQILTSLELFIENFIIQNQEIFIKLGQKNYSDLANYDGFIKSIMENLSSTLTYNTENSHVHIQSYPETFQIQFFDSLTKSTKIH